ncbi:tripartite tricarboxylate transporter substrate binding protein [Xenophilus arseniciresistens]|uniref:Tripartite tricarboxylate transporter substrate binding protein n=1 Tax=Xenophilus arseniciresistens TaxID=1283306 RepID=A0AAE3N903_9BURK|nr:tripartite tricarboxylate transporter substrate binding protein [Xenophilus arseniciresistens]MDA7416037.1 tripartite tricarboxylate transporter substrate binding protein [Xenophilus arseniciresistens]
MLAGAAMVCALPALPSLASAYPNKPIRLVVPFPPGSITDVVARALSDGMSARLGQPVVIDNQAGANGIVGTVSAVKAAPDGYTLFMVGVSTGASNVSAFKALPYDPRKDFTPVGTLAEAPFMLVVGKHLPVRNLQEFLAYARAQPNRLSYGYGSGSAQMCAAQLVSMGGFSATAVAYRGVPQAMTDLAGGTIDFTIADLVNGQQQAKAGRVTAIGVTSQQRSPLAPDIPSLAEGGLPDYDLTVWFGMAGPARLPAPVVQRVNAVLREVLADATLRKRFETAGLTPLPGSAEAFGKLIDTDIGKWGAVFKAAGLEPQ